MPDIIKQLPDSIANQIAAGEVVQRPASVVKELMENAVDAGATRVKVIVKDAGKQLIQVIDDGKGMSESDARMSLERHATSKIATAEDLFALTTMGFRGEALASISAVSQFELQTRQSQDELGTMLITEGSAVKKQEKCSCPPGTSISVKNLFFNIPARRNFLKGNPVELKHITDEFIHVALAHPQISFLLASGDEIIFDLPTGKLSQRIVNIFGKSYQQQLAACTEETTSVKVNGYIGRPELARRTRSEQFLFVNNRFIRNNYLHHAVMNAFEGLLPEGSYPFYALFLEIDPKHIDVNVHPTKTEIKFIDERAVYTVVRVAVRHALGMHQMVPAIDFSGNINLMDSISKDQPDYHRTVLEEQTGNRVNVSGWQSLYESNIDQSDVRQFSQFSATERPSSERVLFQYQNKYIVREVSNGLMFIDQQAAHERVLYDRYLLHMKNSSGASQQMLFPLTLDFTPSDFILLSEMKSELDALGFRLEEFGKQNYLFTGVPPECSGSEKQVIEGLVEQFKMNQNELKMERRENLARSLSKKAAIRRGQPLSREQQEGLVRGLFSSANPSISPDGSPTYFIFEGSQMDSYFA